MEAQGAALRKAVELKQAVIREHYDTEHSQAFKKDQQALVDGIYKQYLTQCREISSLKFPPSARLSRGRFFANEFPEFSSKKEGPIDKFKATPKRERLIPLKSNLLRAITCLY